MSSAPASLQRLALQAVRRNMHRLDAMCRSHARSSAVCGHLSAAQDSEEVHFMGSVVPVSVVEEILVAAAANKLAGSLRSLARVNPMIETEEAFDNKYWRPAVECDFAVRPLPGPFEPAVRQFKESMAKLDTPADSAVDKTLIGLLATYPFSVQLLKATGAGVALKRISAVKSDPTVVTRIKHMCAQWKALYVALKAPGGVTAPPGGVSDAAQEAIDIGRLFEDTASWKQVYENCEALAHTRALALGARLKEKAAQEQSSRHSAAMLAAAPRHHAEPKRASSIGSSAAPRPVTAGGYQAGRSIRQTLGGGPSKAVARPAAKRSAAVSQMQMLGKSTKRVKTVVAPGGGVMRVPRR